MTRHCLDSLTDQNVSSKSSKSSPESSVASSVFKFMLSKSNVVTVLCQSVGRTPLDVHYLDSLSISLSLSTSERVIVGLALAESEDNAIKLHGKMCILLILDS